MSEGGGGLPDLSTILSRVSENPQAMAMLSSLLGDVKEAPTEKESHKEEPLKEEGESKKDPPDAKEAMSLPIPLHRGKGGKHEDRRRLLIALKPFLSAERRQALETLLLVLEATSLFSFGKEPPCT